jgi:hypothetical protein
MKMQGSKGGQHAFQGLGSAGIPFDHCHSYYMEQGILLKRGLILWNESWSYLALKNQAMKTLLFSVAFLFCASTSFSQGKDYSSDVASVDAIMAALYDVISGDPGAARDWDRFRNLFRAETRLIPTRKSPNGELTLQALTPEEYVTLFSSRISTGFFERELNRVSDSFGTVTHVFSTYETKEKKDGPATNRGVNSIQLFHDGKRYFIVNIFWCAESLGFPLPPKYLGR